MRDRIKRLEEENASLRTAIVTLHRIANLLRSSLELKDTWFAMLTGVTAGVGLGFNRAMLFLLDEQDRSVLRGVAAIGPDTAEEADRVWRALAEAAPDLEALHEMGLSGHTTRGALDHRVRQTVVNADGQSPISLALRRRSFVVAEGTDDLDGLLDISTSIAAPLRGRDELRGVLYADNFFTGRKTDAVTELVFAMVADHAGRAIESAHRFEHVAAQAKTDALTGLPHHGALMDALRTAVEEARRTNTSLALLMIDLDGFKHINDAYGHQAGDAILAELAARIRGVVRGRETAYRYGGEEFSVILPGTDLASAIVVGERIRETTASRGFLVNKARSLRITCSVGAAARVGADLDANGLVAAADGALLAAKRAGKNRVVRADDDGGSA